MSSTTAVLVTIVDQVQAKKLDRNPIDVSATAAEISSMHPECGMGIEEIEQLVKGMASKAGVTLVSRREAA